MTNINEILSLDEQIQLGIIKPVPSDLWKRIKELTDGVEVDLDISLIDVSMEEIKQAKEKIVERKGMIPEVVLLKLKEKRKPQ